MSCGGGEGELRGERVGAQCNEMMCGERQIEREIERERGRGGNYRDGGLLGKGRYVSAKRRGYLDRKRGA